MILALALILASQTADLASELTMFCEATETGLRVEESWSVKSFAGRSVPIGELTIPLPAGAKRIHVSPESKGFAMGTDGQSVVATTPLEIGETRKLQLQYDMAATGEVDITRTLPFALDQARVILEDAPGVVLGSTEPLVRTERTVNSVAFVLWDLKDVAKGRTMTLSWKGLPAHARWPRSLALALIAGIVALAIYAVRSRNAPGADPTAAKAMLPLSGTSRRERLVRAVELVDRDLTDGKLDADQHARRRAALVSELAVVLRDIELEGR